jgi:DNA-binding beta-propeller fold protein YncE
MASRLFAKLSRIRSIAPVNPKTSVPRCSAYAYDDSAYDAETRLVYTANGGDGTVSIIQQESPDNYRVFETVKTASGARNMALDRKTKKIFLPLSDREPPPPPTAQNPNPRGNVIPGTFRVLVFGM